MLTLVYIFNSLPITFFAEFLTCVLIPQLTPVCDGMLTPGIFKIHGYQWRYVIVCALYAHYSPYVHYSPHEKRAMQTQLLKAARISFDFKKLKGILVKTYQLVVISASICPE